MGGWNFKDEVEAGEFSSLCGGGGALWLSGTMTMPTFGPDQTCPYLVGPSLT